MMKKPFLIFGAASLALATPAVVPTPAQAQDRGATNDLALCRDVILPEFPESNLGRCVGFNRTSDEGFNTFICQSYRLLDPVNFDDEFDTFGDCVKAEHSIDD
jgi:hypothetical protein